MKIIMDTQLFLDANKENNANAQNIKAGNMQVSNFTVPIEAYMSQLDKECNMNYSMNKVSTTSIGINDF